MFEEVVGGVDCEVVIKDGKAKFSERLRFRPSLGLSHNSFELFLEY